MEMARWHLRHGAVPVSKNLVNDMLIYSKSVCSQEVVIDLRPGTYTQSLSNAPNENSVVVESNTSNVQTNGQGIKESKRKVALSADSLDSENNFILFGSVAKNLKSRNIFLTRHKHIKVGDFGIARMLQSPEDLAKTAIGTPYYLSPEIYQRKPYNYKSDIWALGCLLFEMTALEYAFKANDFLHLVTLILNGKRKELPRSPAIQELVNDLLQSDPDKRPSTEEILAYPSLQPYLSEYMLAQNSLKSYVPRLISPIETGARRSSASDIFESLRDKCMKRRASVSNTNQKAVKQRTSTPPKENEKSRIKTVSHVRVGSTKRYLKVPYQMKCEKSKKTHDLTYIVKTPTFAVCYNKKEQSCLTVSCDSYTVPDRCGSNPSSSKLSQSEDEVFNDIDCGYQSEDTRLVSLKNPMNPNSQPCIIPDENGSKVFNKDSKSTCLHNHSQCHQCMLDTLWKNRIRWYVNGSVNYVEYYRLRNKLFSIYKKELFTKLYESLTYGWEGNEDPTFQSLVDSLNYEQVQSLPLMMQMVQLDQLMKAKRGAEERVCDTPL
ncbi:hypothetical protein TNIN_484161 [Trichonephila inaurata madagascariensis]|uniref:non-specific serine/threonine protein kinase n=1 Tax=Trichonephila inaurata madagascariensis TaxID=2747483 RepID=A0A8X6IPH5_9ARAC|nr:hypothetical protein TNIN_484161 [Trichonephila inaurata madagascariensis]